MQLIDSAAYRTSGVLLDLKATPCGMFQYGIHQDTVRRQSVELKISMRSRNSILEKSKV